MQVEKYELLEKVYKSNLSSRAKQIMFYLINRANNEGTCFPFVKTIANDCGISTRTVQRTMLILVDAGFIIKNSRFRENGGQKSNLYTLKNLVTDDEKEIEYVESKTKVVQTEKNETTDFYSPQVRKEITEIGNYYICVPMLFICKRGQKSSCFFLCHREYDSLHPP